MTELCGERWLETGSPFLSNAEYCLKNGLIVGDTIEGEPIKNESLVRLKIVFIGKSVVVFDEYYKDDRGLNYKLETANWSLNHRKWRKIT